MARLTSKARSSLPTSDFALPKSAASSGKPGKGSFPIPDPAHGRAALSRVKQFGTPAMQATVKAKVASKFPGIQQSGNQSAKPMARKPKGANADTHEGVMNIGHNGGKWK